MTGIQWTDRTWNPVRGCCIVSAGCKNCYAMRQAHRFSGAGKPYDGLTQFSKNGPVWTGTARFVPEMLGAPLSWRKPARVFVNSMSDLFHDDVTDGEIAAVFGVMAACPQHKFQILTKRPDRMLHWLQWVSEAARARGAHEPYVVGMFCVNMARDAYSCRIDGGPYLAQGIRIWPLPNVWLGVSCENQAAADERIPLLLQCPAAVRFVSAEPLLGPIDFRQAWVRDLDGTHWEDTPATDRETMLRENSRCGVGWVIVGGESGSGSRPCDIAWIESIVSQCRVACVPVFVKQLGARCIEDSGKRSAEVGGQGEGKPYDAGRVGPNDTVWRTYRFKDRKGGAMAEWPQNLRVRQWPEVQHG